MEDSESEPLLSDLEVQDENNIIFRASGWNNLWFFAMGFGPCWGLVNSLYLELPWFEITQPEGINLSAWMGGSGTIASAFSLLWSLYGLQNLRGAKVALFLVLYNIFICILMAFFWADTIGGNSVFIYFGTLGAAMVGNIYYMFLVPWIAANFPIYTSAFMSGNSFSSCFGVALQLMQSPGDKRRFSPTLYFLVMAVPSFVSLCPILYIQQFSKNVPRSYTARERESMCPQWFLQKGLKYVFINIVSGAVAFWILTIILPFACANTDPQNHLGTLILQWSSAMASIGLLIGNALSSYRGKEGNFHLLPTLFAIVGLELVIFLCMWDVPGGGFWSRSGTLLIVVVTFIRIGFGYLTPLLFQDIARRMPGRSEKAGRLVAFWYLLSSMIVIIVMFVLTKTGVFQEP